MAENTIVDVWKEDLWVPLCCIIAPFSTERDGQNIQTHRTIQRHFNGISFSLSLSFSSPFHALYLSLSCSSLASLIDAIFEKLTVFVRILFTILQSVQ